MKKVRTGFARTDISSCIEDTPGFRRPLEAVCAVFDNGAVTVALVALDLIEISPAFCRELQVEIGTKLGIAAESVLIHTTHTHTAPWDRDHGGCPRLPKLGAVLASCAASALAGAKPARVRAGNTDVGQSLSIRRRADTGPELGMQTFWFGYTFHEGDDRPDASALVSEMKSRWLRHPPRYERGDSPVWFDRPVDPIVQAITFEDESGDTIGSIVRFCAHPHCASSCRDRLFDPDYPAVARDVITNNRGGECMFLLGPSADIAPKEHVIYEYQPDLVPQFPFMGTTSAFYPESDTAQLSELTRIGSAIGQAALTALADAPAEALIELELAVTECPVPLEPLLPKSADEIERMKAVLTAEYEALLRTEGPTQKLRSVASRLNWLEWAGLKGLSALTGADRARSSLVMPLAAVRLNTIPLAFMHSEVSMETTEKLRAKFPDRGLWTVSLTGGSIEYMPTAQMIDEGGYEGQSTIAARDAEEKMCEAMATLVASVL